MGLNFRIYRVTIPEMIKRIEQNVVLSLFAANVTENEADRMALEILRWFPIFVVG